MAATRPSTRRARSRRLRRTAWPTAFLLAIPVLAVLAGIRLSRFVVAGPSMAPTLLDGDRLLVLRGPPRLLRPRAGQLVVARPRALDGREVVKRVDTIAGHCRAAVYHLRGDNLPRSTDSRHFGPVARTEITGLALLRYWPDARRGRIG